MICRAPWHQGCLVPVSQQTTNDDGDLRRSVIIFREARSKVARVCFEHYELRHRRISIRAAIGRRLPITRQGRYKWMSARDPPIVGYRPRLHHLHDRSDDFSVLHRRQLHAYETNHALKRLMCISLNIKGLAERSAASSSATKAMPSYPDNSPPQHHGHHPSQPSLQLPVP
jgi:hypothetical protein